MDRRALQDVIEQGRDHWWYRGRRVLVKNLVETHAAREGVLVDIGCASGDTLLSFKDIYRLVGVEVSNDAAEIAQKRGLEVVVAALPKIPLQDSIADVVLMLDVLEHIEDDSEVLNEIYRVLKPGGTCVIFVPAFMFLWGITDVTSHHYRRYTHSSLVQKIDQSKFTIERSSYFNTFFFLPIAFVRLATRILRLPVKSEMGSGLSFFNPILYAVFRLEVSILPYVSFPFGVSLTIVLKKNIV